MLCERVYFWNEIKSNVHIALQIQLESVHIDFFYTPQCFIP
jgi:hypothetical protein